MRGRLTAAGMITAALLGVAARDADAAGEFIWPVGGRISSTHVYPGGTSHNGSADISRNYLSAIGAGRFGYAVALWQTGGCGNGVWISHVNGYKTGYCHMAYWPRVNRVNVGTNQVIGYVGSTGNSTGPHLHYRIERWGVRLVIPSIWIGMYVTRGNWVPGTWSGLATSSVLFRARVTAGGLNVRTGPGTGYGIVGTLGYGAIVNVYGMSSGWYKILYGGYYRWIAGWYTVKV